MNMLRKIALRLALATCLGPVAAFAQQPSTLEALRKDFPLTLNVTSSEVVDLAKDMPNEALKAARMGATVPFFVAVRSTINGEVHWWIHCRRENLLRETIPCVPLAAGRYPARWVHNGEFLEVLAADDNGQLQGRFYDVAVNPSDLPGPDDEAIRAPRYQFQFPVPKGKHLEDYPLLLHVYGATQLALPAGTRPVYTHCGTISYGPYGPTHINCSSSGGGELYVGYVMFEATLDGSLEWNISCSARFRWQRCPLLGPGFYAARWKDQKRRKLAVLVSGDGKTKEVSLDAKSTPYTPPTLEPPHEARPPEP